MKTKTKIFLIDTSAILSGKPLNLNNGKMMTTTAVAEELQPGGKDYQLFQLLKEQGLHIQQPTTSSLTKVENTAKKIGEHTRLSPADKQLLALALDLKEESSTEIIILSDDYSIQNLAQTLKITYQGINQQTITKKFKWQYRCPGCKRTFNETVQICPICGTKTKTIPYQKKSITQK